MMSLAARLRLGGKTPSRSACWICGLPKRATIHGDDTWWQHQFEPAILTKVR